MLPLLRSLALAALLTGSLGAAEPARIAIDATRPGPALSPLLYGIFFEEINRAGEGGLYAELVQNRSFEDDLAKPVAWSAVPSEGSRGGIALDASQPLNGRNPISLRIDLDSRGSRLGAANEGFNGIPVRQGKSYRLSLYARASYGFSAPLEVTLEAGRDKLAAATIEGLDVGWRRFETELTATGTSDTARLVLSLSAPGSIWVDQVSLMPADVPADHPFRADLLKMLHDLKPAFVRFPGGCYVEGDSLRNAFRWKDTIGDPSARPGHWNLWGYRSTDGLGYHEYLQLCEDLKAEPMFVINCGMAHQDHATPERLEEFIQDALDAVEYANGAASTKWGALRAAAGHPEPFNMKYLEIGNENGGPVYEAAYARFHAALKARYPELVLIANVPVRSAPVEIVDEHYYSNPEFFLTQTRKYDTYDRDGARIYVGEYAVTSECGNGNLIAALAEAAFMTGMERNGDVVVMSSYAPLFVNPGWKRWNPNAIVFDAARSYGTPSYHVQALFAAHRADVNLPVEVVSPPVDPEPRRGRIGVGTWNTQAEFKDVTFTAPDGAVLFRSDFGKGTDGWDLHRGRWQVVDGALRQTSGAEPATAFAGDRDWRAGTLRLKARKLGGAEGFLVSFQSTDPERKTWWNLGGWGNREHGVEAAALPRDTRPGAIETGRWYDIRIELADASVRCYLDDALVHELKPEALTTLQAVAGRDSQTGEVVLKVVNHTATPQETAIELGGLKLPAGSGRLVVLSGPDPAAENSFDAPRAIAPVESDLSVPGPRFTHTFPARSVSILRLPAAD